MYSTYQYVLKWWLSCLATIFILLLPTANAAEQFLPADQAFAFNVQSMSSQQAQLSWKIAPDYYLYQHKFAVTAGQQKIKLDLPAAQNKHDAYFGETQVYFQQVQINIDVKPRQTYTVLFQGCAEKGLCYPIQHVTFTTDTDGLVIESQAKPAQSSSGLFVSHEDTASVLSTGDHSPEDQPSKDHLLQDTVSTLPTSIHATQSASDQLWSARLHQQSLMWSMLLFLGLGCLLAFTPCSLPMLPILSSVLIRKHTGVRAWSMSLIFVLSMATVYAALGLLAASAGSNFQRWLQQPMVLIGFSLVFVLFSLNLFGLFELKLPQRWVNHLNVLQTRQQGGTLLGAALMGILSALLVGPCMTAPLAGTLLYISQSQNLLTGTILLFCLGFGMGIPLLLLSVLGSRMLPKPGIWMHQVRHIFGFLMLGLSLYFIRPLLPLFWFNIISLLLALSCAIYLLSKINRLNGWLRYFAMLLILGLAATVVWQVRQDWQQQQQQTQLAWNVVQTAQQFEIALQQAKKQHLPVVVDVYADWCVACQPIEHKLWNSAEVQVASTSIYKIKLDLSQYDASQQEILNRWQMLGPPTVLFLNAQVEEQRSLRLTGEFKLTQLLQRLEQLQLKSEK